MLKNILAATVAAATLATGAIALTSARAGTGGSESGEFGPAQGFSQSLGSKHAVGFFKSQSGRCSVVVMVSESLSEASDELPPSAVRFQVMLDPAQTAEIASAEQRSLKVTCGPDAESVALTSGATPVM